MARSASSTVVRRRVEHGCIEGFGIKCAMDGENACPRLIKATFGQTLYLATLAAQKAAGPR